MAAHVLRVGRRQQWRTSPLVSGGRGDQRRHNAADVHRQRAADRLRGGAPPAAAGALGIPAPSWRRCSRPTTGPARSTSQCGRCWRRCRPGRGRRPDVRAFRHSKLRDDEHDEADARRAGGWTKEQIVRMDERFVAAVRRANPEAGQARAGDQATSCGRRAPCLKRRSA